ncbi:MAG: undecaprenyl-diphosphate phosphatase [Candidatus Omnitrophica bacterium]|nr:undecaprenyl-diphosphate phosphatase [Candidatus Omnitrophota bacterium]
MFKYIILGIVQGLTEFFPVSSSGHLAVLQKILGMFKDTVALSVVLHFGTALAVIIFFFKDILTAMRSLKLCAFIIIVTVITGIIGVGGKHFFEGMFGSVRGIAIAWFITACVLLLTKKFADARRKTAGIKDVLILGVTQGLAIAPGISRSGITISTLLFRGIDKEVSFSFSFLVSIPAILGAGLLEARDIDFALKSNLKNYIIGFVFSFLTGLLALWLLKKIIRKAKLHYFGYYCIIVAALTLLFVR